VRSGRDFTTPNERVGQPAVPQDRLEVTNELLRPSARSAVDGSGVALSEIHAIGRARRSALTSPNGHPHSARRPVHDAYRYCREADRATTTEAQYSRSELPPVQRRGGL
jgi:hypothetical protein